MLQRRKAAGGQDGVGRLGADRSVGDARHQSRLLFFVDAWSIQLFGGFQPAQEALLNAGDVLHAIEHRPALGIGADLGLRFSEPSHRCDELLAAALQVLYDFGFLCRCHC